jgi:ketosteroid isomerase-like protein
MHPVIERLQRATNEHDVDAIAACFAPDYRSTAPVHPARDFTGRDQVRRNWTQILGAVGDLRADVLATAVAGDTVWTEWEHRGTRPDGSGHLIRGVVIFEVRDELISGARFYLEPVDAAQDGVEEAVRRQVRA